VCGEALLTCSAVQLASCFGSSMVLQRDVPANVWGFSSSPGATVEAALHNITVQTSVDASGYWQLTLPTQPASPIGVDISFKSTDLSPPVVLTDVLFGDVFLFSGQSNTVFTVGMGFNASTEIKHAKSYPSIRVMTVGESRAKDPQSLMHVSQPWVRASAPGAIGGPGVGNWSHFSAIGWFSIRNLFDRLDAKIPMGVITSAVSATSILECK
jgi:sialate O-acetylesterase